MNLTDTIKTAYGSTAEIVRRYPVSGGDINSAYALELSDGSVVFMKANSRKRIGLFESEADSLAAIKSTQTVRTPRVIAFGEDDDFSFLLLEHIESGPVTAAAFEMLGKELAEMHMADTSSFVEGGNFGFSRDNYLGSGIQLNNPKDSWIEFFRDCRLMPLFEETRAYFDSSDMRRIDVLLGNLDKYLVEPDRPSLLHGDLWGGNYMIDIEEKPWLIDPASYVGHAEADIAMTELFGGFGTAFYDAYINCAGLDPGYRDRKDLYNLYHLLKHLKLFGSSYLPSAKRVINRYTSL